MRALYGLKSSGAAFRKYLAGILTDLGFTSCVYTDADVWRKPITKKNGNEYYSYILTYVDDCLVVHEDPEQIIHSLSKEPYNYRLKDVGPPTRYLGAEIGYYDIGNIRTRYMSARIYLKHAIEEIEREWGNLFGIFFI